MLRSTGPVAICQQTRISGGHTRAVESGSLPYHRDSDGDSSGGNEEEVCDGVGKVEPLVNTHREFKFAEVETVEASVLPRPVYSR